MNHFFNKSLAIFTLLALIAVTSSCTDHSVPSTLRIGIVPWPGYALLSVAAEQGYFKQEGVDVELVKYSDESLLRKAYAKGEIHGLTSSINELLFIRSTTNKSPQIFLVTDFSNGPDVLLSQQEFGEISELRGKKIGVDYESVGIYLLAKALQSADMDLEDVRLENLSQSQMVEVFNGNTSTGPLAAAVSYPPHSTALLETKRVKKLFSSAEIPGHIVDVVALEQTITEKAPDKVRGIIRAFDRAIRYLEQSPEQAKQAMADELKMNTQELAQTLNGLEIVNSCTQKDFFIPNGILSQAITTSNLVMRRVDKLTGRDTTAGMLTYGPIQDVAHNCS